MSARGSCAPAGRSTSKAATSAGPPPSRPNSATSARPPLAELTGAAHPSLEGAQGFAEGDTTVAAVVDWYGIADVGALLPDVPGPDDPFVTFAG
jgi:hypothetical protein